MPLMRRVAALGAAVAAARRYARQNPEKVNRYADQAAEFVNSRTGGRYRKHVDSAVRQVRKQTSVPGRTVPFPEAQYYGPQSATRYPSQRTDRP
ncbi:antitoxin [Actinomycetospora chlora]|jgi:predicted 2-oxoglutarate/Fe(II)-dependent dioxygenase YbiX|uniref:Antitoxin n=1 Tax=Actinomycetospora chlora TaxID=663608 RepID=A0ABP9C488_9PSEU